MAYGDYVNSTLQQYGGDLSRPTKFSMLLEPPAIGDLTSLDSTQFDILCKTVNIPVVKNEPIEVKYKGHDIKVVGRTNFEQTFSVTLYVDDKHHIRTILDEWIRYIDNQIISGENQSLSRDQMFGQAKIIAQNFDENYTQKEYIFYNVFPISISGPEYNTEGVSSVQEFTVDFAFSYFNLANGALINPNKIFEDTKNKIIDMGINKLAATFGGNQKTYRRGIPAAIDLFKKTQN
jgi:hypothetical protein